MFHISKVSKNSLKNLKPGGTPGSYVLTDEDRKKSIKTRQLNSKLKQSGALELFASLPLKSGQLTDINELESLKDIEKANLPVEYLMAAQVIKSSLEGDLGAYDRFLKLTGQDPDAMQEQETNNLDDGFIDALKNSAAEDWKDE